MGIALEPDLNDDAGWGHTWRLEGTKDRHSTQHTRQDGAQVTFDAFVIHDEDVVVASQIAYNLP